MNESKFLVSSSGNSPVIMCEKHAQIFEKIMMLSEIPHTIYELEIEDSHKKCQACNMTKDIDDLTPRIILPGDM